ALIAINLLPRSVEPGWIPIISTRDSLPDWSQNSASGHPLINRYIVDVLQHVESIVGSSPADHAPSEKTGILPEIDPAFSTSR
ncbi:hypothetical protein, partial [Burkholderia puraquae]|uniref:hypothetical protein n=1 Tax=Burkholderia puraquae TaxID=1904757 RepID=UPI001C2ED949